MTLAEDDFSWWTKALAGERGPIYDGEPQSGFYRQKAKDGTYEPVAYWKDSATGEQRCHVNGRAPSDQRALEMWPYVSKNPVTAEAYWHRIDNGSWPDVDQAAQASAAGPDIDPAADPVGSLKAEIDRALKGVEAYASIDSDEQSAKAQTLRSTLTELKGKAEKAYEERNRPLLDAQKALRETWFPLRDNAQDGSNTLRKRMEAWEDIKRENAKKAAASAEEAAKAAAAANAPDNTDPAPEPPAPPPNIAATPAPSTRIRGGSGRTASVGTKKVVTAIDLDKAIAQFRDEPEFRTFLLEMSQRVVDAGFVAIGATVEEKASIR